MEYINIILADSGIMIPTLLDPFGTQVIQEILDGEINLKEVHQTLLGNSQNLL